MINTTLITSNVVIAKVIADLDLREEEIRISDIREWVYEAMLKIGAVQLYEHKVAIVPLCGHLAPMPCDMYRIGQVAVSLNGHSWSPMRKSNYSFSLPDMSKCSNPHMIIPDDGLIPLVKNLYGYIDDLNALEKLNSDVNLRQTLSALVNQYTYASVNGLIPQVLELQYTTKPGYIITNAPCGWLKVAYYASITDAEGMPMIPNIESYKEAIYWYVTMKLLYPRKLQGMVSQSDYYDIRNSYNFYRKQAYAEMMMPTNEDQMESIKNDWLQLYPEIDDHDTFFATTGNQLLIYTQ